MLKDQNNPKVLAAISEVMRGSQSTVQKDTTAVELSEERFEKGEDVGGPGFNFSKIARSAAKKYGSKEAGQRVAGAILKKVLKKESVESVEEATDTPGNSYQHQCAIHVKHEQFGEGRTLFSQHAEPDTEGHIEWYDVMFGEGIKRVNTSDIEILVSESHTGHKKKMKEEASLEEGRGRPRKNPSTEDSGPEPDAHIYVQLSKARDMYHDEVSGREGYKTKGGAHVKFDSGTHFVHADHAKKVLSALDRLKPADRSKMNDHIKQSHANFQAVHKLVS